jgi:hypothetical protein
MIEGFTLSTNVAKRTERNDDNQSNFSDDQDSNTEDLNNSSEHVGDDDSADVDYDKNENAMDTSKNENVDCDGFLNADNDYEDLYNLADSVLIVCHLICHA